MQQIVDIQIIIDFMVGEEFSINSLKWKYSLCVITFHIAY